MKQNKEKWKTIHDRLARELGVNELSKRYYSYMQKNALGHEFPVSGFFSWDYVCEQFVNEKYINQCDADRFIKEKISLVELCLRLRGEEVAQANAKFSTDLAMAATRDATPRSGFRVPGSAVDGLKAWNAKMNSVFEGQVAELNERFRRAKAPLTYHNGFIQLSMDQQIEKSIGKPFWDLVADPLWKNVDIDMKEALDRRDSNYKDPALFAAKALESAIKIIVGMHFTQPTTRCRMWSWKSQGTPFRALIILEHSRTLINGLAAKVLALNLLRNFDGVKALFAPVVEKKRTSRL